MAFKQVCSSLLVTVACCSVLTMAAPLSYLSDNNQNGFPFGNQGSFTYLNDNSANQVQSVYPIQSGPVNYINNIGNPQIQTIASYPNTFSNVGFGSNIINNVNSVNGLSTVQYPTFAQALPVNQIVSYPSVQSVIGGPQIQTISSYPNTFSTVGNIGLGSNIISNVNSVNSVYPTIAQTLPVNQVVGYPNNNQITNNQVAPVEVNVNGNPGYYSSPCVS